jgi:hypothetical protein
MRGSRLDAMLGGGLEEVVMLRMGYDAKIGLRAKAGGDFSVVHAERQRLLGLVGRIILSRNFYCLHMF